MFFFKKALYLHRYQFCVGDDGSPNIFAAGIFYVLGIA